MFDLQPPRHISTLPKPVKLRLSKCFPVCPRKWTLRHQSLTSQKGQDQTLSRYFKKNCGFHGPHTSGRASCQEAISQRHSPHRRRKDENHDILIGAVANGDSPAIVT
jgi:hypothetical protein